MTSKDTSSDSSLSTPRAEIQRAFEAGFHARPTPTQTGWDFTPEGINMRANAQQAFAAYEVAALASPVPRLRSNRFDCAECGQGIAVDEDGCCRSCGHDATVVLDGVVASPVPPTDIALPVKGRDHVVQVVDALQAAGYREVGSLLPVPPASSSAEGIGTDLIARVQAQKPTCANPEDCCRELSRVWTALGIDEYNGKSASENVRHLTEERDRLQQFIESRGYRRCDIAVCNCNGYHGGNAEDRLREISETLGDATNGNTIHGAVLRLIADKEAAEARLTALQTKGEINYGPDTDSWEDRGFAPPVAVDSVSTTDVQPSELPMGVDAPHVSVRARRVDLPVPAVAVAVSDGSLIAQAERLIADCELGKGCGVCPVLRHMVERLTALQREREQTSGVDRPSTAPGDWPSRG